MTLLSKLFSKKYLLFFFISFLTYNAWSESYPYHISEGNNFFDLEQLDQALIHYKKAIQIREEAPDAYFQIGHIHLLKGFNQLALKYFTDAESYSQHFLIKETLLDLYINMAATYHREKYWDKEIKYLNKILTLATNEQTTFYQGYAGKALFLLGLLAINQGEKAWAKQYFLKATVYPYRLKSCFLYLAHYYAVTAQEIINTDLKKIQKKRTKNKNVFFNYYYNKYDLAPLSEEEKDVFLKEPYRKYVRDIEEYKRQQERQKSK